MLSGSHIRPSNTSHSNYYQQLANWNEVESKLRGLLLLTCTSTPLSLIQEKDLDAPNMFKLLRKSYCPQGFASLYARLQRVRNAKSSNFSSIGEYGAHLLNEVRKLAESGCEFPKSVVATVFISGLDEKYEDWVDTMMKSYILTPTDAAGKTRVPNVYEMVEELREWEIWQRLGAKGGNQAVTLQGRKSSD